MKKNKLDAVTFCKLVDMFGERAAQETLADVNLGKIRAETVEKYLFIDETKEEYAKKLKEE